MMIIPNPDIINFHGSLISGRVVPGRLPLSFRVPECIHGFGVGVAPSFGALTVGEISVRSAHSDVQDQVEFAVERGIEVSLVLPGIVTVGEASLLPEALGRGVDVKDEIVGCVNIGRDSKLVPNKPINVEIISQRLGVSVLFGGQIVAIGVVVWSPVKRGGKLVISTGRA